jgi:hypothetical protein
MAVPTARELQNAFGTGIATGFTSATSAAAGGATFAAARNVDSMKAGSLE